MSTSKLAFYGGSKTISKKFPWPVFTQEEVDSVKNVVESGDWGVSSVADNRVALFEKQFAEYIGAKHSLSVVNGSVALRIALIASGIKPGDEVIVPAMTFIATASIVVEANCVPVFVDIEKDTYNIDPNCIEAAITDKTKAIIAVHFGGHSCDMDRIMKIAKKYDLFVIEDACHAHGGEYEGKKLGTIGNVGCFSFQASKNMSSGEGGIVITNDSLLYENIFALKNVGRELSGKWYEHFVIGCNYRLSQFQAAILSCQLSRLDEQNELRAINANYLDSLLSKVEGLTPIKVANYVTQHAYHLYILKYDRTAFHGLPKDKFIELLSAEGVPSAAGYPQPLYKQPVFQNKNFLTYVIPDQVDYRSVKCPETENACYEECIWLVQSILLGTKNDMDLIVEAISKIKNSLSDHR